MKITDYYDTKHKGQTIYMKEEYEISGIVISDDSKMLAVMDTHCGVSLFKKDY
jgi:hypothetical protein